MKYLILMCFLSSLLLASSLKDEKEKGEQFGKQNVSTALKEAKKVQSKDLISEQDREKTFDSESARKKVLANDCPTSEITEYIQATDQSKNSNIDSDEYFIKRAEEVTKEKGKYIQEVLEEEITEYETQTCLSPEAPFSLSLLKRLEVTIHHQPEVIETVKRCLSHTKKIKHFWKSEAEKEKKKQKEQPLLIHQ